MFLRQIFDPYLAQYAYLIGCQRSGEALIIDPERDISRYQKLADENGLHITSVAETHIHADFVSGGREFAEDPKIHLYLSAEGGNDWSYQWPGHRPNTRFLKHGDQFLVGNIRVEAVHTPGHTPEHLSFLITDLGGGADAPMALTTGDFVFVGDVGRPDLLESAAGQKGVMEPSARTLQASLVERLKPMEDYVQILPAHGAGSACGKSLGAVPTTTMGYERHFNKPLRQAGADPEGFVKEILRGQPEPPLYFATMKRVNRDGIRVTGGVPEARHLTVQDAKALMAGGDAKVLDSRDSREAFSEGHLPRAIHVPLNGPFFSAGAGSYVAENEKILVIAKDQAAADLAAVQLYRIGLDGLAGWIGIREWVQAGEDLVTSERILFSDFDRANMGSQSVILDVRTTSEFEEGHLPGALSIPYTRLRARLDEVPKGQTLLVHCGSGKRASLAASFLKAMGFATVHIDGVCAECERIASSQGITH
ncbi:MAG: rhodanese-like domain-containing protein [Terrimicrobiaceae bacterium]